MEATQPALRRAGQLRAWRPQRLWQGQGQQRQLQVLGRLRVGAVQQRAAPLVPHQHRRAWVRERHWWSSS